MRISREEALRMAVALDTANTSMEHEYTGSTLSVPGISKSLRQDSLIHLRELRSAALRANRDAAPAEPPA
jgi:hypothetical protein